MPLKSSVEPATTTLEQIEVELLLEGVYLQWGFDFRQYAPASLLRRLRKRQRAEGLASLSELQALILHDFTAMQRLLADLSVNVSAMFRYPSFYLALREKVVPYLSAQPALRVWSAGCSSGEEVLSLAILLKEEGLYERTRLYATDINADAIEQARRAYYPLPRMRDYTTGYIQAGGQRDFSDYYRADADGAQFDQSLLDNVVFAQHNLVSDHSFNEFHLILCRNVLIYFARPLQERVLTLFHDSLAPLGILGLGPKESLRFATHHDYEPVDERERIYRRNQ